MSLCCVDKGERSQLKEKMEEVANKGFRAIAGTTTRTGKRTFVGIVARYDAPRPDSRALVSKLWNLGIKTKMLTGDALPVAKVIANMTGIGANIAKTPNLENLLLVINLELHRW